MNHFLIIGLGNPEKKYDNTWHNLGFASLDALQKTYQSDDWKNNKKFCSYITEHRSTDKKIILAKPQTYMNNSGAAVAVIVKFYKIPAKNIVVVHDELDLPMGTIRISHNISAAGHNGIKSIIDHLGTKSFVRIRLGIGPRQDLSMAIDQYVLQKIPAKDKIMTKRLVEISVEAINYLIINGSNQSMNKFN